MVDERGQSIAAERLPALIAGNCAATVVSGKELRQQTFLRMRESGAAMAVDVAGRTLVFRQPCPFAGRLADLDILVGAA